MSLTSYGWSNAIWVLASTFQYGYHIAALNQIQAVLTCKVTQGIAWSYGLPTCIPMSDATFSLLTAVFTVGGFLASLVAGLVMDKYGRKGALRASSLSILLGASIMVGSGSLSPLLLGRLLTGVGSGFALCVVPIYISEIAPPQLKGRIGITTQLSVVIGILVAQAIGLYLSTPTQWRIVLAFSGCLSLLVLLASPSVTESPAWLSRHGFPNECKTALRRLWDDASPIRAATSADNVEDPLLDDAQEDHPDAHAVSVTVPELLKTPELRRPLLIVSLSMLAQQLSGINAVMYYSNEILAKALPEWGPYISLSIAIVNVLMTFPPLYLIERMGRKPLLELSVLGVLLSLLGVGLGLDMGFVALASVAILAFVMTFAVGLGPIPFVMIPEVSPVHAVSALSSVGVSLNWMTNFVVGLVFLPLRNALSGGDPMKEGRVFFVFFALTFVNAAGLFRVYRG